MIQQFDNLQKLGKDHMDATLKTLGTVSKGAQAIAVEVADYSKKSFEQSTAVLEKLVGARTLEKALEIQTDYLKSSYETLVAQSSKLGEIYTNIAKEAYKPYETLFAQAQATTQSNVQAAARQAKAA
jgi:phasin family protein